MAYYIHLSGKGKVPREKIREVEEYLGIRFPEAYVQIVMEHNRGAPFPNIYEFEGPDGGLLDSMISNLIPFSLEKSAEQQNLIQRYYDCH